MLVKPEDLVLFVSTLLEILARVADFESRKRRSSSVSTLLEILAPSAPTVEAPRTLAEVSTLLEILDH